MRTLRPVHAAAGVAAYAATIACVVGVDQLVPGFWDWQAAEAASRWAALRGVAVPPLLFAAAGTALAFPSVLKRAFSPRISGEYLMPETVWHSIGYLCLVLAIMVASLLLGAG